MGDITTIVSDVIGGQTLSMSGAHFSEDRQYRYVLWRQWDAGQVLNVIGLNPSIADETLDDPTIRRCIRFAKDWGYGGLVMTNLFAYRSTDPTGLDRAADPVGPLNNRYLENYARTAGFVLAAWGVHGKKQQRGPLIASYLRSLDIAVYALGVTKDGAPRHPLYVSANKMPVSYGVSV